MSFRNYYDTSSYGRSRADGGRTSSHTTISDRPTSVTAKYITPSYKTSSIPVLCRDRSTNRDNETPITTIANRYANYSKTNKDEKLISSKYGDRKDTSYNRLTVPSTGNSRSREPSPVSSTSKYSINLSPRALTPDRRSPKTLTKGRSRDPSPKEREKDIPNKTDKPSGYSSGYSSYKLYPRASSYNRAIPRTETKPEITLSRYGISNRLSSSYLRGSSVDKPIGSSVSSAPSTPSNGVEIKSKDEKENEGTENLEISSSEWNADQTVQNSSEVNGNNEKVEEKFETITVITRHTSPTPPGSSVYVRTRRADMAKTIEKTITRSNKRPAMADKEMQSDRLDDSTRTGRFASTTRASVGTWSTYTPSSSKYCGYAGRYSTQYANTRDNSLPSNSNGERSESSRSHSTSPMHANKESLKVSSQTDIQKKNEYVSMNNTIFQNENNPEVLTVYKENEEDETSEIIINVNLKLKKAKSHPSSTLAEMVSPEVTITNSNLPPQAPKVDDSGKTKKVKVRKSSTDSSTDSKKRIIKKRRSSPSSAESDQSNDNKSSDRTSAKDNQKPSQYSGKQGSPSINDPNTSGSLSKVPSKSKHSIKCQSSRESNSPDSTITTSTQTSCSDDEVGSKSKYNDSNQSSRSNDISRTSADDISISLDKSTKHSPSPGQRVDPAADEAKTFLIKALAPVTNFFKIRHQESTEDSHWLDSTSESTSKDVPNLSTESDCTNTNKKSAAADSISNDHGNKTAIRAIRHIESGERAWWLDSDITDKSGSNNPNTESDKHFQPRKIRHIESGDRAWWLESSNDQNENLSTENKLPQPENSSIQHSKCNNYDSEEIPWWLDNNANVPEGIERLSPPKKSNESEKGEKYDFFKIRHIDSGEKDWWHSSNSDNISQPKEINDSQLSKSDSKNNFHLKRIRHVESGERPWWLSSNKSVPEGIQKLPTPSPTSDSDSSDSDEVQVYTIPTKKIPPFPLMLPDDEPLGARRSPEGLETPREDERYRHRHSPYENTNYRQRNADYRNKLTDKLISRYTDIDDILGTSGHMHSPFMDSILARRTGQTQFSDDMSDCEEIDPTQVRIHDSTPQRPVIQKLRCRSEIIDCRDEDQLDDAALQVYKDGDYGAYLDLDSTLGEQEELLDGLQENRKNAVVLRTQLSVRVHTIMERLRTAEGRELRKALFTLKQILQSDKDLVHEFVTNNGLDCLMTVGASDQTYLDYILRALGQIMLYVDGMHGVMCHKDCIPWLYSLISSKFRHVVKTSLKLLLVFVEYTESNCLLLIKAIHQVDTSEDNIPWYKVMKILKDFDASDTELLIYATTLINRCLNHATDRDTYYDQVDALEAQCFDDIIQLYMSKQGTDLDLLRQFQIYEAVLLHEDGDDTGTALKQLDDSIINLIQRRRRSDTDRRISKKRQMKDGKGKQKYTSGLQQRIYKGSLGHTVNSKDTLLVIRQKQLEASQDSKETKENKNLIINKELSIKDIAQRLTIPTSPPVSPDDDSRVPEMTGLIMKAKEGLAKSQSKEVMKSPSAEVAMKVSENEMQWEDLRKSLKRNFHICDLDFSDLIDEDDSVSSSLVVVNGIPPPPPPGMLPPPPPGGNPPPCPPSSITEKKKTVKLFWKEVKDNPVPSVVRGLIWDELPVVQIDTKILEHLFEAKKNDLIIKEKLNEPKKNLILDAKRSNAINIGMKKLPTPLTIKAAIMKMDATVIGREGIEKLLTMLPTEEEKIKIQEAQYANPDLPLGSAEQFLLALASISELPSRLKLWLFKLDFDNAEKEIAEPLMDLKQGMELLKVNKTFRAILSTLRSVGSFLNGTQVKGFRLEYLAKVMEVKDTVHKHPLLYHICEMIIQKFPDSSDFFSEVGPVIRASKVDFDALAQNLHKLEVDCKASWDHLKKVAKHDGPMVAKTKVNEFLTDAAERIILLGMIQKRVMNRFNKFLLFIGVPISELANTKPTAFLKILAEFALEYMTSRERVLRQLEKKANHRERNKTRGKLIIDVGNYANKNGDVTADAALRELLMADGESSSTVSRKKPSQEKQSTGEPTPDEIFQSMVMAPNKRRPIQRNRKRARLADIVSLERTLKN